ncbi:MAG: UDP-2,3-diacylglucosamine diphosphatase [Deltaproteobacteria bacterium]|nr:UDP-2,3-diacylglucosamine diphosphatase [Deltaproteobacteria bacterium]
MRAIFLSDVHLKRRSDPGYEACMRLLATLRGRSAVSVGPRDNAAAAIDLLVIAGDFFDFWFERGGRIYPEFRPIVESLGSLRQSGIRICLCEGNHDFFLTDYFSRTLGIDVYPGDAEFMLDGTRCWVSHGDTVDRNNRRYLALRRVLRSPVAYRLQRTLPLEWLWGVARLSSKVSKGQGSSDRDRLLIETMRRFAVEKSGAGFDAVILGHCHTPSFREEEVGGRRTTFVTLGDWAVHQNYLECENGRFSLNRFEPGAGTGH